MMDMGLNLAYIGFMSWRDYIDPEDRAELERQKVRRDTETANYNKLYKALKSKGEQRKRRGKNPTTSGGAGDENR